MLRCQTLLEDVRPTPSHVMCGIPVPPPPWYFEPFLEIDGRRRQTLPVSFSLQATGRESPSTSDSCLTPQSTTMGLNCSTQTADLFRARPIIQQLLYITVPPALGVSIMTLLSASSSVSRNLPFCGIQIPFTSSYHLR